jgi:hypothetical protein
MKLIGAAALLLAALLLAACGGSSSKDVANPTFQALIDEVEQTPVEDYERAYAKQLCDPFRTFFEATVDTFREFENQPTPASLDELDFDAFGDIFGELEEPFERLLEDAKDIDPPEEMEEFHEATIAELEYALESIKAIKSLGLFGAFGLGTPPPSPEEPPGLNAAIVLECGPELEEFFEEFGGDFLGGDEGGFSFDDETPSPPRSGEVGEAVENGAYELTVHRVVDPVTPGDEFFGPDEGNRWLMVEVSIRNVSDEAQDYGSYDFKVKDADNFEYTTGFVDLERELSSGTLLPGDTVRGQVGFEVPARAEIVRLIFDPGFFGEARIDITLP